MIRMKEGEETNEKPELILFLVSSLKREDKDDVCPVGWGVWRSRREEIKHKTYES